MEEWIRILIEEYCSRHHSKKSFRLAELEQRSYDINCDACDDDFIFLEK